MRSLAWRGPARTLFRRHGPPHYGAGCQRGDQLVGGLEAARSQRWRNHRFERFQFHGRIGARVHFGRLHVRMTEPEGHLAQVLVACSTVRAHVCRSTCGETCLLESEGQSLIAVWAWFARMYSKAERVSGWPRALTKTSGVGTVPRTPSQARRAVAVTFHRGKQRSRRPLPRTRTVACG
jgi:hypothetical protein